MRLFARAWRALWSPGRALARRLTRLVMGSPPQSVADQVAAAAQGVSVAQERAGLTPVPSVRFNLASVQPPSNLYVGPDDFLEVEAQSELSTEKIQIFARLMLVTGEIKQQAYTMPVGGANPNPVVFALAEGYLLSLQVFPSVTTTQRGQLYVTVFLKHGPLATSGNLNAILAQGYIDAVTALAWPGGYMEPSVSGQGAITSVAVTNPAAGADFSFTVPTGERLRLRSLTATLTTAVAVANRQPVLNITDGTSILFSIVPTVVQTASLAVRYSWGAMLGVEVVGNGGLFVAEPLPDVLLEPGFKVTSVTGAIAAADQWSAIHFCFEQWQSA